MIKIVENKLEGHYAAPRYHPVTCANPMPWLITEMRIEIDKIWIRGEGSMWFRLDQCNVSDSKDELQEWLEYKYRDNSSGLL